MAVTSFDYDVLMGAYEGFTGPMDSVMSDLNKKADYLEELAKEVGAGKFMDTTKSMLSLFGEMNVSFETIKTRLGELVSYAKKLNDGINN